MARTSYTGYLRQYGGTDKRSGTPGVFPTFLQFTVDISLVGEPSGVFLPLGAIPLFAQNISGNGTAAAAIDIGRVGQVNAYASPIAADGYTGLITNGIEMGTELTARTEITTSESVAGTGNVTFALYYIMQDDQGA